MMRFTPTNLIHVSVALVLVVSSLTLLRRRRRVVQGFRLPPGPLPLPFVGNALSIDAKKPWTTYAEWATHYGDIFMIRILKQDIVVIHSKKIAKELLEHRSSIYSDRPHFATKDPFGWDFNFGWAQYGDHWRSQRRIFHQTFRAEAAVIFRPIQLRKTHQLLLDMFSTPNNFTNHIQRFSAAIIMSTVYDYDVTPEHDYFVTLFERGNVLALESLTPEASAIIDAFPFVLSLPEWFPGAVLRRKAVISKRCAMQMIAEPFEHARKREATGSRAPAMALDYLRDNKDSLDDPSQLQLLRDTCATAFVAGAETTTSTLLWFMLAMLQNQEVQQRAQAEIDMVVGTARLPGFDDRPNLPYIEAVLMETFRMYPIAPLGLPHSTTVDDVYEGIFIPKGSTVVANIWAIYRDKDVYADPDEFKPERFIVDGKLSGDKAINTFSYGFGRRVCPGRYLADTSVWAAMVSILCAFKITKALDEHGKEVEFEPTFTHGVTTAPNPFPCSITPRLSDINLRKLASADNV